MSENKYKIGQLAEAAGLTIRTIRYYDEMGLLKSSERTSGGQRIYSDADLVYIKRIMELKNLSFSLEEIKRIILLSDEDKSVFCERLLRQKHWERKKIKSRYLTFLSLKIREYSLMSRWSLKMQ